MLSVDNSIQFCSTSQVVEDFIYGRDRFEDMLVFFPLMHLAEKDCLRKNIWINSNCSDLKIVFFFASDKCQEGLDVCVKLIIDILIFSNI